MCVSQTNYGRSIKQLFALRSPLSTRNFFGEGGPEEELRL